MSVVINQLALNELQAAEGAKCVKAHLMRGMSKLCKYPDRCHLTRIEIDRHTTLLSCAMAQTAAQCNTGRRTGKEGLRWACVGDCCVGILIPFDIGRMHD